jgi:hypothetical protein
MGYGPVIMIESFRKVTRVGLGMEDWLGVAGCFWGEALATFVTRPTAFVLDTK